MKTKLKNSFHPGLSSEVQKLSLLSDTERRKVFNRKVREVQKLIKMKTEKQNKKRNQEIFQEQSTNEKQEIENQDIKKPKLVQCPTTFQPTRVVLSTGILEEMTKEEKLIELNAVKQAISKFEMKKKNVVFNLKNAEIDDK
eukprot:TRINITY_DN5144_c0_g1_i1.p1 TRINITY_DN5144_c0_g1~~TRINITY_DN5144_c0_g1_i1.p1  ORF type:complete len:141 (-),score=36.08 TRINITY_DN5144_c0_g1_i1:39-461(-)